MKERLIAQQKWSSHSSMHNMWQDSIIKCFVFNKMMNSFNPNGKMWLICVFQIDQSFLIKIQASSEFSQGSKWNSYRCVHLWMTSFRFINCLYESVHTCRWDSVCVVVIFFTLLTWANPFHTILLSSSSYYYYSSSETTQTVMLLNSSLSIVYFHVLRCNISISET